MSHGSLRKFIFFLILSAGIAIGTQVPLREQAVAKESELVGINPSNSSKLAVANITRVMKEFKRANDASNAAARRRQEYVDEAKTLRERLAELSREIQQAKSEVIRDTLKDEAKKINRQIEDLDGEAQQKLTHMSETGIVQTYQQIKASIAELAEERGVDLIMVFPDLSEDKNAVTPAIAQVKLQTPALTPYYCEPELDLTDEVIARVNKKFPPKAAKMDE